MVVGNGLSHRVFVNARLHVSGGALGGGRMVEDASSVAAAGVWCDRKAVVTSPRTGRYSADAAGGEASVELTRRCRHAAAAVGDLIFMYGGLRGGVLLDDLLVAEDLAAAETTTAALQAAAVASSAIGQVSSYHPVTSAASAAAKSVPSEGRAKQLSPVESSLDGAVVMGNPVATPANGDTSMDISTENALSYGNRGAGKGVESLVEASAAEAEAISLALAAAAAKAKARESMGEVESVERDRGAEATSSGKPPVTASAVSNITIKSSSVPVVNYSPPTGVRLHHRAVVVAAESGGALGGLVRQLSIDQFENEGRRVSYGTPDSASAARKLLDRQMSISGVQKKIEVLFFPFVEKASCSGANLLWHRLRLRLMDLAGPWTPFKAARLEASGEKTVLHGLQ
ncbi:hypothetical protein AXG93_2451s1010 [Marchantia polymorpha subsp. ruderalis]|uniref:Uncharacterized protein n=1 Tax=Marchantia polymorpha subsp. ruderalis TaxID=1480154 RepID=A0A176VHT4_MARPO|nr:hypothetical protein AXG93_2451s1010 [Marchantia polymorpha subsp. ruderalis]